MAGGSYGDGSLHSDTIVRWNTAKELPIKEASNKRTPEAPHLKHDVRFNLPEFGFNHDHGRIDWLSNESENQGVSVDETFLSPDHMPHPRADSVATHILDSSLARADHVLRLRKQARQERRALKESGDYLGVQGINPETGRMDVETPTDSDESQPSFGAALEKQSRANRMVATFDPEITEKEKKKMLLKAREDELRLLEKSKQEAEEVADQLMWRRHTQEWSIVKGPGTNEPSGQQPISLAENVNDRRVNEADRQRGTILIDLDDSQTGDGSHESLDSPCQNDQGSIGTVVRTPHPRSSADVSRAALELFENGISFGHSFRSKRTRHRTSSGYQSSDGISPTTKVQPGTEHAAGSDLRSFLGRCDNSPEDRGGETNKPGHRTVSRKAFRELTTSLRAKKSLSSILMNPTQARGQTMAKEHTMRKDMASFPTASHVVGAWTENSLLQTAPSLPIIEHQESLHMVNGEGFVLTTDQTCQVMSKSKDESLDLDPTEIDEESQGGGGFENEVPNTTTKRLEAKDESAYTHITTTTGSMQQEVPPSGDYKGLAVKKQEKPTTCWPEKTSNDIPKAEGIPADIPSDITSPELMNYQKDAKLCALKTTRATNRLQLRQKKADIVTPSIGSKASTDYPNLVDALLAPRMALKVAYTREREKKKREAVAAVAAAPVVETEMNGYHCDGCSECLRIPGSFPAHLIAGDAIASRSAKADAARRRRTARLAAAFDCTLGQFVALMEIYCRVVWPVFDPYSDLWERNASKETTVLDVVVLVLAVPGAIVVIGVAVWGFQMLALVGELLWKAAGAIASNVS